MGNNDWLQDLKAGDEVAVYFHSGYGAGFVEKGSHTVQSVTATYVQTVDERGNRRKFRCKDGGECGIRQPAISRIKARWSDYQASVHSAKLSNRFKRMADGLGASEWDKVPLDKLERIAAILDEPREPTG